MERYGHTPVFSSEDESQAAYREFGRVAVNWGPIELSIEAMIIVLRNSFSVGISPRSNQWTIPFPVSFSKKAEEVKDLMKRGGAILTPHLPYVQKTLGECKILHKVRTTIVHSICEGSMIDGRVCFVVSDQKNTRASRSVFLSIEEIRSTADAMLKMQDKLSPSKSPHIDFIMHKPYGRYAANSIAVAG